MNLFLYTKNITFYKRILRFHSELRKSETVSLIIFSRLLVGVATVEVYPSILTVDNESILKWIYI